MDIKLLPSTLTKRLKCSFSLEISARSPVQGLFYEGVKRQNVSVHVNYQFNSGFLPKIRCSMPIWAVTGPSLRSNATVLQSLGI